MKTIGVDKENAGKIILSTESFLVKSAARFENALTVWTER